MHDAIGDKVGGLHALAVGHLGGVVDVAMHDDAGTLGRKRGEPGVLGGHDDLRGQERERPSSAALSEQHRDGWDGHRGQGRDAAGDLTGDRPFLCPLGQLGARGVDDGHQREAELLRQPHPAPRLAESCGAHRRRLGLPRPVLAHEDARLAVETGQGHDHRGVPLPFVGPVQSDGAAPAVPQQVAHAGPTGRPRAFDRGPGRFRPEHARRTSGECRLLRRVDQHSEYVVDEPAQLVGRHHGVDHAMGGEVLRGLHPGREGPTLERLVDLRPEEADQRAGLGHGDVRERSPGREDTSGCGVAEIGEVGESGGSVGHQGPRDLGHQDEGGRTLLHSGAA